MIFIIYFVFICITKEKGLNPLLEGHPHRDIHNGVEWTTGSEGHGLPATIGMALSKKNKKENGRNFCFNRRW